MNQMIWDMCLKKMDHRMICSLIVPLQMDSFDESFSVVVFHRQSLYIFQRYREYFSMKWLFFSP